MKNFIYIVIFFLSVNEIIGQNDSLSILVNESDTVKVESKRNKGLFAQKEKDEKHLFKLNLSPLLIYRPTIAFEQRLGKKFSLETSFSIEKHARLFFFSELFIMDENKIPKYPEGLSIRGYQMFKYYYNLNSRQKLGKPTNGFSGNFLAIQFLGIYANSGSVENYYFSFIGLSTGLQRRIGNIGYIEPSAFVDIALKSNFETPPIFHLGFKLKMGFAIESISDLRRSKTD